MRHIIRISEFLPCTVLFQNLIKMKPSKKSFVKVNRKNYSDDDPSKIKSYFKEAAKQFSVKSKKEDVVQLQPEDNNRATYIQALENKLKSLDSKNASDDIKTMEPKECAPGVNVVLDGNDASTQIQTIEREEGATGYDESTTGNLEPNVNVESLECVSECSSTECIKMTAEYVGLAAKHKALKKVYFTVTSHFTELRIKYEALLKAKSHIDQTNIVEPTKTDDFFTQNELKFLDCMSLDKKKDSSFILQCLEFVYKNDLKVLRDRTLKGTAESTKINNKGDILNVPAKGPISPIKVVRIKELFLERIAKCDINSVAYIDRVSDANINKLFSSGIKNIAKKQI